MSIQQQNHVFLDPESCGSSVGYYIAISEYENHKTAKTDYSLTATVVLADCSHKIDWGFGTDSAAKIELAISMLQEFRKKYLETEKMVAKLNK